MILIYTCIAKNIKSILCEYTEFNGNFEQISYKILEKATMEENFSIEYDKYKFFVVFDGNIKALCLANLDSDINDIEIFEFLSNILKKLFTKYTYEFLESAPNYSLREFVDVLKNEMKDFHKIKKKFKKDKKGLDFSFYSNEEMKQTFLNKSLGLFIFLFLF